MYIYIYNIYILSVLVEECHMYPHIIFLLKGVAKSRGCHLDPQEIVVCAPGRLDDFLSRGAARMHWAFFFPNA